MKKTIHAAAVISVGLLLALWWSIMPPRHAPVQGGSILQQRQAQCPANSRLEGKLCVCPKGTSWTGEQCVQVWSSAPNGTDKLSFARTRVRDLPDGLASWEGKVKAINSRDPVPGSVAVIETGTAGAASGEVAIVEAVSGGSMTIIEGGQDGSVHRRSARGKDLADAARQLRIVGYYTP